MKYLARFFIESLVMISLSACRTPKGLLATTEGYGVQTSKLWPSKSIPVCWENGSSDAAITWQQHLRSVVDAAFSKTTVRFVGWGHCLVDSTGIRIEMYGEKDAVYRLPDDFSTEQPEIEVKLHERYSYRRRYYAPADGHPRSMGIGKVDGVVPGNIILNRTLSHVLPRLVEMTTNFNQQQTANFYETAILHELGHRIGLYHEQARPDSDCFGEPDSRVAVEGAVMIGAHDPDSIMNYCLIHKFDYKKPLALSPGDIEAINSMYAVIVE